MSSQEQLGSSGSDSFLPGTEKIVLEFGAPAGHVIQLKQQSSNHGDEFAPKMRKPYTISKQRERWTEDEHNKFLEALKLYGRAWRRIEEHVATKTAVQIRSHAQKFFSKVVRESTSCDPEKANPIDIPPPRPKRKPTHPYPRKVVRQVETGILIPDRLLKFSSSRVCISELENQSPTSVLSATDSDATAEAIPCTPSGSPSSISSALALNSAGFSASNDEYTSSYDRAALKLDLPPQNRSRVKEGSNESAVHCLKLFGKTLLVADPHGQMPSPWLTLFGRTSTSTQEVRNLSSNQIRLPC